MQQESSPRHNVMTTAASEQSFRGYVSHQHPDVTSEGFGSHARGVIYPLLHIAIVNDLKPLFWEHVYASNTARDYTGLNVGAFFGLPQEPPPGKYKEIEINTWSDTVIGSACGDATVLASLIEENLDTWTRENDLPLLISLVGSLCYMNPSKPVWQWLQQHSNKWYEADSTDKEPSRLHIAAHVRVPEDFCSQSWKDDNAPHKLTVALEAMQKAGVDLGYCDVAVYTEERFSQDDEGRIKKVCKLAKVYRGTSATILKDIKSMAMADIFLPSSSHLSAMAGYLSHGLIVLEDSSRWEYFEPHKQLGNHIVEITVSRLKSVLDSVQRKVSGR